MIKEENKDLAYWKANAEEDYIQVPISVLRYISELETVVKNCSIPDVRERLINYIDTRINYFSGGDEMKSMNESIRDEIFVKELEEMKKVINDNKF